MGVIKKSPFNSDSAQSDELPVKGMEMAQELGQSVQAPLTPDKPRSDLPHRPLKSSKARKYSTSDLGSHLRNSSSTSLPRFASNPLRMGLPRGRPGMSDQLDNICRAMGAATTIYSVLVANNGIAAVKFIRSIRSWAYKVAGDERAVSIVVMATPEDMRIDAEHIRIADQFVEVPGGTNNNNYANVPLIAEIAERANVDAVWPGWGHASEKPELPTALAELPSEVQFLGPPAGPMAALGDKIGSSILAQAAGVPTIPWSGSGLSVDYAECKGEIPQDVYDAACIKDANQALQSCQKIGFPIMLKASWGGGGKGIRKCTNADEVLTAFKQVQGEVPGSPIFAMKLAATSRHLEVQLICDKHGNVCSLYSRDCSVQRRHQKIVEEGPVTKAPPEVLRDMERCARSLAKSVNYVGAATVEYLYDIEAGSYYFLELNPRLQVEHPVTEWISQVNIPACQLMIGMGIPLHKIPDIRRVFNRDVKGSDEIDFENDVQAAPSGHVVAVRVTCEDADNGFKPTGGKIDELNFRTSPEVWGYFSVKSGGGIHEFSDSQFGHLFAKGESREAAIRAMVVALKEIKIRGEIRTIVDYAIEMIQSPEFVGNEISTGWLDSRIASQVKAEKPVWYISVVAGAILRTLETIEKDKSQFVQYLEKGHMPPSKLNPTSFKDSFVLEGVEYTFQVTRTAPYAFRVTMGGVSVDAVVRRLNDGGIQMRLDGQSYVVHSEEEATSTRLIIDTLTCLIQNQADPSCLVMATPGKLLRFLVEDGQHVSRDQPFAEVEVMKMVMPLISGESGILHHRVLDGALIPAGFVVANLDLDNPNAAKQVAICTDSFPELGPPLIYSSKVDQKFKTALTSAKNVMQGYEHPVDKLVIHLLEAIEDPALALMQWDEVFSVAETRIPAGLASELKEIMKEYAEDVVSSQNSEEDQSDLLYNAHLPAFPSEQLLDAIKTHVQAADFIDRSGLEAQLEPLIKVAELHASGRQHYARSIASDLLQDFLAVEDRFAANKGHSEQEVIEALRLAHSDNLGQVADIVLSHQGKVHKVALALHILAAVVLPAPEHFRPQLRQLAALGQDSNLVARQAQHLLEHSLLSELHNVVARALSGLDMFEADQFMEADLLGSDQINDPNTLRQAPSRNMGPARSTTTLEGLYTGLDDGARLSSQALEAKMKLLVEAPAAVEDALASLLDHSDQALQWRALATYINRIYFPYMVREPEIGEDNGFVWCIWIHSAPFSSSKTPVRVSAAVIVLDLESLPRALQSLEERIHFFGIEDLARSNLHIILPSKGEQAYSISEDATNHLASAGKAVAKLVASPVVKLEAAEPGQLDPRVALSAITAQLTSLSDKLVDEGYSTVSVLSRHGKMLPMRIGFQRSEDRFVPDALLCAVEPPMAEMLELSTLKAWSDKLTYSASINRQCHTYAITEQRDARSHAIHRVFSRCLIRRLGKPGLLAATYKSDAAGIAAAAMEEVEAGLVQCLHELERLSFMSIEQGAMKADWAHVFLSVLPALPLSAAKDVTKIAMALKTSCAGIMARLGSSLRKAAVAQVEIRLRTEEGSMAWRLVLSSPTGHEYQEENVTIYRESTSEEPKYIGLHSKAGVCGPLDGAAILAPYQPLKVLEQRRLAARRHKTTYCYDFPSVLQTALRDIWSNRARNGEPGSRPLGGLVEAEEIVMMEGGTFSSDAQVEKVDRPAGLNDVGMVAWLLTLKTPECPQGRQVVVVANDITFTSGSFGPREDAVFKAVTDYAMEERLPLIYLAANSGARVGLANELKNLFQVEWNDETDPSKGFKYIYLSDDHYSRLILTTNVAPLKAVPSMHNGEKRWVVTDIIGLEDGIGVECLSGSGAIASAYSRAFADGLPITFVSGRSVGIGAYLARLGRRCIQRADQPMILTGYAALNKLLGREVYTSHMQLGGPKVMGVNGVSHEVVADDLEGATAILQWLSTMPPVLGSSPALLPTSDPLDRSIAYCPANNEKLDPRAAIRGRPGAGSLWESGLFDKDTWREANAGWARTVVTGRARLAGIAVGVIAVESMTTLLSVPADPGAPDTAERIIPQAGQVWFPDSATKTAHAIEEFDRESLPLVILANWRGFSGGQRDLFEGILQAGSMIVESLRVYKQPVTVYLPPGAELRGGAWVVIDSQINPQQIEMYADPTARGGVLEPEGMVEIKFRSSDFIAAMHRLDKTIISLKQSKMPHTDKAIKKREAELLPVYRQIAISFAEMHDTPVRMTAKGVINGIIPWARARPFLAMRLKRRLAQEEILKHIMTTDSSISRPAALFKLKTWFAKSPRSKSRSSTRAGSPSPHPGRPGSAQAEGLLLANTSLRLSSGDAWEDDRAFLAWAEGAGAAVIASELKSLRTDAALQTVTGLTASAEGKTGLLQGLAKAMKGDAALRAQLQAMMSQSRTSSSSRISADGDLIRRQKSQSSNGSFQQLGLYRGNSRLS